MLLAEFDRPRALDGRRAVIRNDYPARARNPAVVGPVEVQVAKVRDPSGAGLELTLPLAPPHVRRGTRVATARPRLSLQGIAGGNLGEALPKPQRGLRQGARPGDLDGDHPP